MAVVHTPIKGISSREKVRSWMAISHGITLSPTAPTLKTLPQQIELRTIAPKPSVSHSNGSPGSQSNTIYHIGSGSRMSNQLPPITNSLPRNQMVSMVRLKAFRWAALSSKKFVLICTNGCNMVPWSDVKEYFFPWCSDPTCEIVLTALKLALGYPDWAMQVHPCSQREQLRFGDLFKVVSPGTILVDISSVIESKKVIWDIVVEMHQDVNASVGGSSCGSDNPIVMRMVNDVRSVLHNPVNESSNDSYISSASEKFTNMTQPAPMNTPRETMSAIQACNIETLNTADPRVRASHGQTNSPQPPWQSSSSDVSGHRTCQTRPTLTSSKLGSPRASTSLADITHHALSRTNSQVGDTDGVSFSRRSSSSVQICGNSPASPMGDAGPSDSRSRCSGASGSNVTQISPPGQDSRPAFRSPIVGLRVNGQAIVPVLFYRKRNGQLSRDKNKWLIPVYLLRNLFPSVQLQDKLTAVYRDFLIGRTPKIEGTSRYARLCSQEEGRDFTRWLYVQKNKGVVPDWTIITSKCLLIQWQDFVDYLPFDTIKFFDLDLSTGFYSAQLQPKHCTTQEALHSVTEKDDDIVRPSKIVDETERGNDEKNAAVENKPCPPDSGVDLNGSGRMVSLLNAPKVDHVEVSQPKDICRKSTPPPGISQRDHATQVTAVAKAMRVGSGGTKVLDWMPKIGTVFQLCSSKDGVGQGSEIVKPEKDEKLPKQNNMDCQSDTIMNVGPTPSFETVELPDVSKQSNGSSHGGGKSSCVNKAGRGACITVMNKRLQGTAPRSKNSSPSRLANNQSVRKDNIQARSHSGVPSKMPGVYGKKGMHPIPNGKTIDLKAKTGSEQNGKEKTPGFRTAEKTSPRKDQVNGLDSAEGEDDAAGLKENVGSKEHITKEGENSGEGDQCQSLGKNVETSHCNDIWNGKKGVRETMSVSSIIAVHISSSSDRKTSQRETLPTTSNSDDPDTPTARPNQESVPLEDSKNDASHFPTRAVKKRPVRKKWFQGLRLWGEEDELPSLNTCLAHRSTVISGEKKSIESRIITGKKIDWHIPGIFPPPAAKQKGSDLKREKSERRIGIEIKKPDASIQRSKSAFGRVNDAVIESSYAQSGKRSCSKKYVMTSAETSRCRLIGVRTGDAKSDKGSAPVGRNKSQVGLPKVKGNRSPQMSRSKVPTDADQCDARESGVKEHPRRHSRGKSSKKMSKHTDHSAAGSVKLSDATLGFASPGKTVDLPLMLNVDDSCGSGESKKSNEARKRLGKKKGKIDGAKSLRKLRRSKDSSRRDIKKNKKTVSKPVKEESDLMGNDPKNSKDEQTRRKSTTDVETRKGGQDDRKAGRGSKSSTQCHSQKPRTNKRKRPKKRKKSTISEVNRCKDSQQPSTSNVSSAGPSSTGNDDAHETVTRAVCKKEIITPSLDDPLTMTGSIGILEQQKKILEVIQQKMRTSSSRVKCSYSNTNGSLKKDLLKTYTKERSGGESYVDDSHNRSGKTHAEGASIQSSEVALSEGAKGYGPMLQIKCQVETETATKTDENTANEGGPFIAETTKKMPFSFQPLYDAPCPVSNRGLAFYEHLVMPYVAMNGYKYVTLIDAARVFILCQPKCQIAKSILRTHKALHRTMCSWEQVYGFEMTEPNKKPPVSTGDMLLRFDTLMIRFPQLEQEVRQKHSSTKLKNSQNCGYVT